MEVRIWTENSGAWFELLQRDRVKVGDSLELGTGVTVRMADGLIRKGAFDWGAVATFAIDKAQNVPVDVVVALFSAWLYDKLKGKKAKAMIERTEIQFDDKGEIERIVREKLEG